MDIKADLGKVGHAFVIGAHKLKAAAMWLAQEHQTLAPEIAKAEDLVNRLADQIYPGAGVVALAIESGMDKLFNAIDAAGSAAGADGMNVQLDLATIAAIKAALPIVKAQAQTTPGS